MINRRQFLKIAGAGTTGFITGGLGFVLNAQSVRSKTRPDGKFVPDLEIALKAAPSERSILPGNPTRVWRYQGRVLKGDGASMVDLKRSYLGPIIRVHRGQKVRIRFTNDISDETIVHWHGLHVPAAMDGHPRFAVPRGETYIYEFEVRNRAGTYWYHPHPHGRTGPQVYWGMAGLFLVSDAEERAAGLPFGEYDIPA
jgi:FtsP/CotA-like multicopper oxidase with cupredoxin domain